MLDHAIELATHKPDHCVILQRPQVVAELGERDVDWATVMTPDAVEPAECVPVAATDPLYILYTSGTTGKPKGIVRDNGGHAVALHWSMTNIYGVRPGETFWAASDVGWVVGHSYIVYAPLLLGATTCSTRASRSARRTPGRSGGSIEEHKVDALFTAPTAFRAIKKEDPNAEHLARYDVSSLRTLFLAGERLDPDTYEWASRTLGVPVVDHWWQTETGWPICANLRGLEPMPIKPGSPSVPVPGYDVQVLDEFGEPVGPDTEGAICIRLPMPPGTLPTLWNDDERYRRRLPVGLPRAGTSPVTAATRTPTATSTSWAAPTTSSTSPGTGSRPAPSRPCSPGTPSVAECAVVGVHDELKGQVPRGFVVLKAGVEADPEALRRELVQAVRDQIGAVAALREIDVVPALPKTRSGKILRKTMREIADGKTPTVPSTIEDASVLDALAPVLRRA